MPLARYFATITNNSTPRTPPQTERLSNNPYYLLDEDDAASVALDTDSSSQQSLNCTGLRVSITLSRIPFYSSIKKTSKKNPTGCSKLRIVEFILKDTVIRSEIEDILGAGAYKALSGELLGISSDRQGENNNPQHKMQREKSEPISHQHHQEVGTSISETTIVMGQNAENGNIEEELGSQSMDVEESATECSTRPETVPSPSHSQQNMTKDNPLRDTEPKQRQRQVTFADATSARPQVSQTGQSPSTFTSLLNNSDQARNPYTNPSDSRTIFAQRNPQQTARPDKIITLKKNNFCLHIHRYTLCFKTLKPKVEEEGHQIIQDTLQKFKEIVLQADPKTILPPYLELDRADKSVPDLSTAFPISSIDSLHALKKYFFCMSPRDEGGVSWCSIVLAQAVPFQIFMDKVKYSLKNQDFSLWPNASNNKNATDVGWLLYSTRSQDEEQLAALLTSKTGENISIKWKPIRISGGSRRKDTGTPAEKNYALHVECAMDRLQDVKDKSVNWYGSSSSTFPDGTKMRLEPTFSSVTSMNNKTKFASCLA